MRYSELQLVVVESGVEVRLHVTRPSGATVLLLTLAAPYSDRVLFENASLLGEEVRVEVEGYGFVAADAIGPYVDLFTLEPLQVQAKLHWLRPDGVTLVVHVE